MTAQEDLDLRGKIDTLVLGRISGDADDEFDQTSTTDPTSNRLSRSCAFIRCQPPRHMILIEEFLISPTAIAAGREGKPKGR
jgi:hypothetical protein